MSFWKIYLAGPITGLDYKGATEWRKVAYEKLIPYGIIGYSPMRNKEKLIGVKTFSSHPNKDQNPYGLDCPLTTIKGITTRDKYDCESSDLVLINFLGASTVSIGTVIEIGWASSKNIPIIVIMEDEGNPHDHGMINQLCGFRVNNIEQGIDLVKSILLSS